MSLIDFTNILVSTSIISVLSLIGLITLSFKEDFLRKILLFLISLSAGALIGGAFFHLIPESIESLEAFPNLAVSLILVGYASFFIFEKILHWNHCHIDGCTEEHAFGFINLAADALHNFIDGLIIAAAFVTSFPLGSVTTVVMVLHEIPQEIGDFGILLHSGMEKKKALSWNFLISTFVVIGGIVGYFLSSNISQVTDILVPFTAGGFIYIAASVLIPEIHKEDNMKKWLINFSIFILGLVFMYLLTNFE